MTIFIVLGVVLVIALMAVGTYNNLVKLRIAVEEALSTIDTDLKKRYDLIPNLVETVKGYAAHEKGVFEQVTKARAAAMGAQTSDEKVQAENMLTSSLHSLFAVAENYPTLQADGNFMHLQQTLSSVEDSIAGTRARYNATVRVYNTAREVFPSNIFAGMFGFHQKEFFEVATEAERQNVKVSF